MQASWPQEAALAAFEEPMPLEQASLVLARAMEPSAFVAVALAPPARVETSASRAAPVAP